MKEMTIGQRIRERRKELGLSQEELAHRLGNKSRASVCTVEKDKEDLTTNRIRQYAEALECTPAFLMGWEDEHGDKTQYKELLDAYKLNMERQEFIALFESVSPDVQETVLRFLKSAKPDS